MMRLSIALLLLAAACSKNDPMATPAPVPEMPTDAAPVPDPRIPPPPPAPTPTTTPEASQVRYQCQGGSSVQAEYEGDVAKLRWNGRTYTLRRVPSELRSYKSQTLTWTLNGSEFELLSNGRRVATACEKA